MTYKVALFFNAWITAKKVAIQIKATEQYFLFCGTDYYARTIKVALLSSWIKS